MKKHYTVNIAVAAMAAVLAACGTGAPSEKKEAASGKYADSLLLLYPRPQSRIVVMEAPGVVRYDNRDRAILPARVAGRIEKLHIRYNYQPVRKGQLVLEIYAPELVAAQRKCSPSVATQPWKKPPYRSCCSWACPKAPCGKYCVLNRCA